MKTATPAAPVTGTLALRGMLRARNKSPHALALIAGEVGNGLVGVGGLEDFINGRDLAPAIKQELARVMLQGHLTYDAATDRLVSTNKSKPVPFATAIPPSVKVPWLDASKLPYPSAARTK